MDLPINIDDIGVGRLNQVSIRKIRVGDGVIARRVKDYNFMKRGP